MYRVMVVDDEEPVLDSFSFIIEKHISGFTLCAKARSGTEAISLVPESNPDVVFMDIHMPGIDGIDTIIEIRKRYPDIVFILATAYERFDIAQRAIPLNVFSYLVKPITRKMLIEEFEKIAQHLDELQEKKNNYIEDVQSLYKSRQAVIELFLSSIMWENPTEEEWVEFCKAASFSSDGGAVCLFDIKDITDDENKLHVYADIDERLKRKYISCRQDFSGRMMEFFPSSQDLQKLNNYCDKVVAEFSSHTIRIGRGNVFRFEELHRSYSEALQQIQNTPESVSTFFSEKDRMEKICTALFGTDVKMGQKEFEQFWTEVFHRDSFLVAKSKMVAFFTLVFSRLDREILEAADFEMNPPVDIMKLEDIKEWKRWAADAMRFVESILKKYKSNVYPTHLIKALSIIHQNYGQPLKLSSIADECRITASYLSRLFSEYMNTSFIDYLNKYRVEQAHVLLRDNNLSVKETSKQVGYQDPNYFSRIFRRYMGMSPTEIIHRRL